MPKFKKGDYIMWNPGWDWNDPKMTGDRFGRVYRVVRNVVYVFDGPKRPLLKFTRRRNGVFRRQYVETGSELCHDPEKRFC